MISHGTTSSGYFYIRGGLGGVKGHLWGVTLTLVYVLSSVFDGIGYGSGHACVGGGVGFRVLVSIPNLREIEVISDEFHTSPPPLIKSSDLLVCEYCVGWCLGYRPSVHRTSSPFHPSSLTFVPCTPTSSCPWVSRLVTL